MRILSPRTVDLMASNHVGDLYQGEGTGGVHGMGFGLSVEVVIDPIQANTRRSAGSFGWDGAFGTHFWVDRKEQLVGLADDSGAGERDARAISRTPSCRRSSTDATRPRVPDPNPERD